MVFPPCLSQKNFFPGLNVKLSVTLFHDLTQGHEEEACDGLDYGQLTLGHLVDPGKLHQQHSKGFDAANDKNTNGECTCQMKSINTPVLKCHNVFPTRQYSGGELNWILI